ncbi:MAG TPA: hypothetical protein VH183_08190, partial [Burkholderiaceae bacterium]|nr:hypothetical protein [Burkholderiaceae bacterium]
VPQTDCGTQIRHFGSTGTFEQADSRRANQSLASHLRIAPACDFDLLVRARTIPLIFPDLSSIRRRRAETSLPFH